MSEPADGLLERAEQLTQIGETIAASVGGDARALVIQGAAGIGKTALLTAARRRAAEAGMFVMEARGGEFEQAFTWGSARDLLTPAVRAGAVSVEGAAALAGPLFGLGPAPMLDDAQASFSCIYGLYWLTATLAERGPIALIIDDLQWCDEPSLRYLGYLLARAEGLPLVLVATLRSPGPPTGVDDLLAAIVTSPISQVLQPASFSAAASSIIVRRAVATASDALCASCHELAGGNPFLLQQLAIRLAAEPERAAADDVRELTPEVVVRDVVRRLERSPPGSLELARAAAVLGPLSDVRRASLLAQLDAPAATMAATALIRADVLTDGSALGFRHPLVRAAVLADLSEPERGQLERAAAQQLAEDGADVMSVAAHLDRATPAGDPWVVATLRLAAARADGATAIAVGHLRRALREPPIAGERAALLLELGKLLSATDPGGGHEELRAARELATTDDARQIATLALAHALTLSGSFLEAVELLAGEDHRSPDVAVATWTAARFGLETQRLRQRTTERLTELASRGPQPVDARISAALAVEISAAGTDREAAVAYARRALGDAELVAAPANASLMTELTIVLVFAEHYAEADAAIAQAQTIGQRNGWMLSSATVATAAALAAAQRGLVSEAASFADHALAAEGASWIAIVALSSLLLSLVERNEPEAARDLLVARGLDGALPKAWPANVLLHHRARVLAALGETDRAIADLRLNAQLTAAWGFENPAMMPWRSQLALALAADGQHEEATALTDEEVRRARVWGGPRTLGVALHAAGVVAGRNGEPELQAAVTALREADAPLELARSLTELGALVRRIGSRTQARTLLLEGLDAAHHVGGIAVAERARNELRVIGARPRRDALHGRDALTPSELRVARMAAEGMTNRAIAQGLFVTLRTVEIHLTSTYAKLGITGRRALPDALEQQLPG